MKNKFLTTLAISSLALGTLGFAQGDRMGPGGPGPGALVNVELPDDVAALRDQVVALRDELAASRKAVVEALGADATREDRAAALEGWKAANVDDLEAMKALTEELKTDIRDLGLGGKREPVEVPDEIKEARAEMQELSMALAVSRREAVSTLGEDATVEEKQAAIATWKDDNAADIAILDGLREEVTTWMQENRPKRGGRDGIGQAIKDRIQNFKESAAAMKEAREQLRVQLGTAETEEEKKELINQFREQYRSLMQERRQLKRAERLSGIGNGGDRRGGG